MPKTDYELTLDDKQVAKALKDTEDKFDKMGKTGDDAMKKVGESADALGDGIRRNVNGRLIDANGRFVAMGKSGDNAMGKVGKSGKKLGSVLTTAVGGALANLAVAAVQLGAKAVAAFAQIVQVSTQAAIEFDATRKKFISIFEGSEDAADAMMDKIGKRASELGIDLNEALSLTRAFVPDVKGTEDPLQALDDLLVGVRALAEEDPAQGIIGARFAIDEAMSGSLRSLKARFEFTKAEIDILKKAQGELGQVVGTIEGINQVMERRGVDVEALKGTFTQAMGEMQFATSKLRIELGKPVADQMTKSLNGLNKILAENSDDLLLMAGAIGDVIAKVVDFVGTNLTEFLEDIDTEGVMELVDGFNSAWNSAELLLDVLFDLDDANLFNALIDKLTTVVDWLTRAGQAAAQLGAMARAGMARLAAEEEVIKEATGFLGAFFATAEDKARAAAAGQKAFDQAMRDSLPAFEKFSEAEKEDTERKKDRKKAQDANTEAALAEAEAFLKQGDAASETADALAELGLAEEDLESIQQDVIKTQEKLVDAEEKSAQERLDLERDFQQERIDLALAFSQERVDIERRSLQDIADIQADHVRAVQDQGLNLSRDVRDMGERHAQQRVDAAGDLRQELIDIEQNYQDELRRIQRTAQQAMEEAERGLDAQAFIAALREQDIAREEAGISRDQDIAGARQGNEERLDDLAQAQERERAALQQSDRDKLEDLQIRLDRELETQALSDQRAFEQQAIDEMRRVEQQILNEERQMEQQAIAEQRRLDALIQGQAERLAKMVEGLDAETAAVVLAEANKLAAVEDFAGAAQAVLDGLIANVQAKEQSLTGLPSPADSPLPMHLPIIEKEAAPADSPLPIHLPIIAKRFGGGVSAGRRYLVGEGGLEGYVPHRAFGGDTRIGQPTIVGEFGTELFIPPSSGSIIPNNQMGSFLDGNTTNVQQSINNTQNNLGGFSVAQSMFEDPIQRGQLENFILDILSRN